MKKSGLKSFEATIMQCPVLALFLLIILTVIAFVPTFTNEFMTGWDDQWQVINRFTERGFSNHNLCEIFGNFYRHQYSPLNQCVYIAIYKLFGYSSCAFHASSLLFHVFNIALVYYLLYHIMDDVTLWKQQKKLFIAFFTALIFAIHPLQVEAVAWISASKIVFCTTFYLLSTLFFIHYLKKNHWYDYILSLLFFICSYGFKEQTIIMPIWLVLLSAIYRVNFHEWKIWLTVFPFFLLALLFGLLLISLSSSTASTYPLWQRLIFACYSIIEYLIKSIVPYRLLFKYYYPMNVGNPLPAWMLLYPIIVILVVVCFWRIIKKHIVTYGLLFFLIHISLVLHIVPLSRTSIVADRYMYMPIVGVSIIVVYYIWQLFQSLSRKWRKIFSIGLILVFCGVSYLTYKRVQMWHDTDTLRNEIREIAIERNMNVN